MRPEDVVWICSNNIDPQRDCFFCDEEDQIRYPGIFIDGTMKSAEYDHFERDWPNVIVMDDETIAKVDEKWQHLDLGEFISSPSLNHKPLVLNQGALSYPKFGQKY
jgi:4-hydroxy-3-polyprenylbenzoate decarboxylase